MSTTFCGRQQNGKKHGMAKENRPDIGKSGGNVVY
jgi:hypothetical protein